MLPTAIVLCCYQPIRVILQLTATYSYFSFYCTYMRQITPVTSADCAPNVPSCYVRKNVHTVIIVDKIDHFMSYLPPLFT